MKKIVTIIIVLAVIVGAFFFFRSGDKKAVTYETVELKRGAINNTVTATGTIEPITKVDVGTQVSGTISRIYADYNSVVKKGQLLAELDRKLLEAELKSEMANLKSSKNSYEYQQKNYKRLKQLHEKRLISDTEFEEAEYQYENAKQTYEKAQATLVKAQSNLEYATIYSPIDGVVLSREVEEGQTVAASFETPTMFTIANDLRKSSNRRTTRNIYRGCVPGRYVRGRCDTSTPEPDNRVKRGYLRGGHRCTEPGLEAETGINGKHYRVHDGKRQYFACPAESIPFHAGSHASTGSRKRRKNGMDTDSRRHCPESH